MKKIYFDNYEDFSEMVADKFEEIKEIDEYADLSIIANYEDTRELIRELVILDFLPTDLILHDRANGYKGEYIITLVNIKGDDELWCEPMKKETGYVDNCSVVTFVLDDCSSKVISYCDSEEMYEVAIGCKEDDEECECDCDECSCGSSLDTNNSESTYVSRDKDGTPLGFSKTWSTNEGGIRCYSSYSHYSNNLDILKEIASDFGVRL